MLELLLNRNQNLAAMGEIDMLGLQIYRDHRTRWVGQCSCERRPADCPVWGSVINRIRTHQGVNLLENPLAWPVSDIGLEEEFGWKRPLSVLRYRYHRVTRTLIHRLGLSSSFLARAYKNWASNRDYIASTYADICNVSGVVDASKDPLQILDLMHYSQLPIKIIYLTRDVRGLAWSALRKGRVKTAREEAIDWTYQNKRMLSHLEEIPNDKWMHIRYEDICADVDSALELIHKFLGLSFIELDHIHERSKRHTIAGNRTRFRDLEMISEDMSWKDHLNLDDLNHITKVAGPTAERLGYQL